MGNRVVMEGFDIMDTVAKLSKYNKRNQATLLANIEMILDKDSPEYLAIRKLVLDATNDFARSVVKTLFGNIN